MTQTPEGAAVVDDGAPPARSTSRIKSRAVRRLVRNRGAMISLGFVLLLTVIAVVGQWLPLPEPNVQELSERLQGPSSAHWLGTDSVGRDTLSRLVAATQVTMLAAVQGLAVAVILGVPLGLLAGFSGGMVDSILSRIADGLLSLPALILALAIVGVAGPGLTNAMVAIGIVFSPRFFRVGRSAAQSVSQEIYIEAVRADGLPTWRILLRHVLPNASGPLLVQASFMIGFIITAEASLSYLGLGVQVPDASWGSMVRDGFQTIHEAILPVVPPAVMITLTVFAFSVFGDGLRDAYGRDGTRS